MKHSFKGKIKNLSHWCFISVPTIPMPTAAPYIFSVANDFGEFLQRLMLARQVNIQDVANGTSMSRATIYRHLQGKTQPRPRDRNSYARFFGYADRDAFDRHWLPNGGELPVGDHVEIEVTRATADRLKILADFLQIPEWHVME